MVVFLCFCVGVVMFLWWCFCGGVLVVVFVWWSFCGGVFVVVFLWLCFCGGVFVLVFLCWCFCGGVSEVVFLWCGCGGVLVVVFLWRCFCGGVLVVVFLWWCTKYYSSTTKYYSVLQSTSPVLLRTTKYYSIRTTKYYSAQQSNTPVLLRTTQYYSSTTPYYKVLLQYYSVLQSTTPILLCTTKYYSSTTPYYRALLRPLKRRQNDVLPVLLRTTPVLQKLPKRAFHARLPQLFTEKASKMIVSCEASTKFHRTSFQNERFARCFRQFSRKICVSLQFRASDTPLPARGFIRQKQNVPRTTTPCIPKFQNVRFATAACTKMYESIDREPTRFAHTKM